VLYLGLLRVVTLHVLFQLRILSKIL